MLSCSELFFDDDIEEDEVKRLGAARKYLRQQSDPMQLSDSE